MSELLRLQTELFELSIWCNDIAKCQQLHQKTIKKREFDAAFEMLDRSFFIRFFPPLTVRQAIVMGEELVKSESDLDQLTLTAPLFFENVQYQFEWVFLKEVEFAQLAHQSNGLNEGFRFSKVDYLGERMLPARLTGSINTGNDVGWMRLPLNFTVAGKELHSQIAFEVLPTKMDLYNELPAMYQTIDQIFPLWRFSLVEKTEQDASKSQHRGHFPLLWLANFANLRESFVRGLKVIAQAPHSRLQAHECYIKAGRLKGRLSHHLVAKVKEDIANGFYDKRYLVEKKKLSVDTPENRFIKMVVSQCKKVLAEFEAKLRTSNQAPDKQRLSDAFFNELHSWQQPLQKILGQRFLKDVGIYHELISESLVLQQKTGYSSVYYVWQELKYYLDVFANQACISMKSVAEIYEVWCFLELRHILINELGFKDKTSQRRPLSLNEFFEYRLKDGFAGAFEFEREDGVQAKLVHEPVFSKKGKKIRSYLVNQEPDIVLEVELPQPFSKRFVWLFDAKYRIKTEKSRYDDDNIDYIDYVPDDAINQMHRYRDALICITESQSSFEVSKSRPIVGAYALYPGYFDQPNSDNPYAEAIKEIGIGAFSLLPNPDFKTGRYWLTEFLREQIGNDSKDFDTGYDIKVLEERLYVQEAARIPYSGMKQFLYANLTMTVALAGLSGRNKSYFTAFETGTAKWYHIKEKTFRDKYKRHIVNEICFLALASTSEQNSRWKKIDKLWPVKNVVLVPRHSINEVQAGKASSSDELYYLFELGKPLILKDPIDHVPHRPIRNSMRLTTLNQIEQAKIFDAVGRVYEDALV